MAAGEPRSLEKQEQLRPANATYWLYFTPMTVLFHWPFFFHDWLYSPRRV